MKVIDLLPVLDVGIDADDCPAKFYKDSEYLGSFGATEICTDAISVRMLLNSEVALISPNPVNNNLRVFIRKLGDIR